LEGGVASDALRARAAARQLDPELRAAPRRRLDGDPAVHSLDELAAHVEAEPAAADALRLLRIEPVELLEDPVVLLRRDADALVRDRDRDPALVPVDAHLRAAAVRRVLDRVLDQVVDDLPEAAG